MSPSYNEWSTGPARLALPEVIRMIAPAALLVAAAATLALTDEPTALIERLGSSHYAEREQATESLRQLGRAALAPLALATREAPDPEVRARAATIRAAIEQELVAQPTRVDLSGPARPLRQHLDAIGQAVGSPLLRGNPEDPAWSLPLTLDVAGPVTYWEALDLVGKAADLRLDSIHSGMSGNRGMSFRVTRAARPRPDGPPGPAAVESTCRVGPFLAQLTHLSHNRSIALMAGMDAVAEPKAVSVFHVSMQIYAEPRLALAQAGPVRIDEAVDEAGTSLVAPGNDPARAGVVTFHGASAGQSQLGVPLPLIRPEGAGKLIARLRGAVPVTVTARRPEPTALALDAPLNRPQAGPGGTVEVVGNQQAAGQPQVIEVVIAPPEDPASPPAAGAANLHASLAGMIDLLDGRGEPVRWFLRNCALRPDGRISASLYVNPSGPPIDVAAKAAGNAPPPPPRPATLHVHALQSAGAEVTFTFRNIPMP